MLKSKVELKQEIKTESLVCVPPSLFFGFYIGNALGIYLTVAEKDSNWLGDLTYSFFKIKWFYPVCCIPTEFFLIQVLNKVAVLILIFHFRLTISEEESCVQLNCFLRYF